MMSDGAMQPCGHPWSAWIDRPGYAWCSQCAQQAEAALEAAAPSRPAPGVRELDTQLAVRLFGWQWLADARLWRATDGLVCDAQTFRRQLPAFSRAPAATALVWQWLETRVAPLQGVQFEYGAGRVRCFLLYATTEEVWADGSTWPEALCRAALKLAATLQEGEG